MLFCFFFGVILIEKKMEDSEPEHYMRAAQTHICFSPFVVAVCSFPGWTWSLSIIKVTVQPVYIVVKKKDMDNKPVIHNEHVCVGFCTLK